MTVVSILNDGWDTIKQNKDEFIDNIEKGMYGINRINKYSSVNDYPVANFCNPMEVATSFHADCSQVFYVGQNSMTMLTDFNTDNKPDIEFQLKRIKEAKKLLNLSEKKLKEKLDIFSLYKIGTILICTKNVENTPFKKGKEYKILNILRDDAFLIDKQTNVVKVNIFYINHYFKLKEA